MKKRIRINLMVTTQAVGDNIKSAIDTFLAGKDKFSVDSPIEVTQDEKGNWHVIGDVRFNSDMEAENWVSDIKARWTSGIVASKILAGSSIKIHSCSHNDSVIGCKEVSTQFREEIKYGQGF